MIDKIFFGFMTALLVIMTALLVIACYQMVYPVEIVANVKFFTDESTGCQYVVAGNGITPRLNNGKPICGSGRLLTISSRN